MNSIFYIFSNEKPQSKIGFSQYEKFDTKTVCGVPCVFPFMINNITFTECIVDQYGSWCSTAVDSEGVHVSGQGKWGECGPGCPIPPPGNK